jgi:ribosomal-protein-alanine N-acetyltransferase
MNFDASKVRIRPIGRADLWGIIEIVEILEEMPHWPLESFSELMDRNPAVRRISLVAEDTASAEVLGFVTASLFPPQAELEMIAVAVGSQRRGLGRQLFGVLAVQLRAAEVGEVWLEVRASNRVALAFYRSLGFGKTGLRLRYYTDPIEDAVLMGLKLG